MNFTLTYDMLLNFPQEFLEESSKYKGMSELLSKEECDKYDTKDLKDKVELRFKKFKDARYIYKYPNESLLRPITPNYQLREVMTPRNLASPQDRAVTKNTDKQIWVELMYQALMSTLTTKMTEQEAIYLVEHFFKRINEEDIAEKLNICRATLQKIQKSCLIKIWVEMEALKDYED